METIPPTHTYMVSSFSSSPSPGLNSPLGFRCKITEIFIPPHWNFAASVLDCQYSEWAVCLVRAAVQRGLSQSQPKCFYWRAKAVGPTAPIGCNWSASQWCVWTTLCKVAAFKKHTHIRPPLFLPSRRFKRSQMGHGEAITPLFVLVLIRLVKCSQAWPRVYTLLPVVREAHCAARLPPTDPVTPRWDSTISWNKCSNVTLKDGSRSSGCVAETPDFYLL